MSCQRFTLSPFDPTPPLPSHAAPLGLILVRRCAHGYTQSVELWDVSGNSAFESGWPAVSQHADGVVLVYNPEKAGNDVEVGDWFDEFAKGNPRVGDLAAQCLVLAHRPAPSAQRIASKIPAKVKVAGLGVVETSFGDSAAATVLQQNFVDFLLKCFDARARVQQQQRGD